MTVTQLLTGRLESEILDGLQRMKAHAPEGAKRQLVIFLRPDDNESGFINATYVFDGQEWNFGSHNNSNLTEAVDKLVAMVPSRMLNLRTELEKRRADIEAQLAALPVPEPVLMES